MKKTIIIIMVVLLFFGLAFLGIGGYLAYNYLKIQPNSTGNILNLNKKNIDIIKGQATKLKKFSSSAEFAQYFTTSSKLSNYSGMYGLGAMPTKSSDVSFRDSVSPNSSEMTYAEAPADVAPPVADRYSSTNVQVFGIDEPDIIKNDGNNIFYAQQSSPYYWDTVTDVMPYEKAMPQPYVNNTFLVSANPLESLKVQNKISGSGQLLLSDKYLIIFDYATVTGFDVSKISEPKELWRIKMENGTYFNTARLLNGKVYLITTTSLYNNYNCPIVPFTLNDSKISIPCTNIYYPSVPSYSDSIYNISILNPATGKQEQINSFTGSNSNLILYMSKNALYVAYAEDTDIFPLLIDFVNLNPTIFPDEIKSQLQKINRYELGRRAKMVELEDIISQYRSKLSQDDMTVFENNISNALKDYLQTNQRKLEQTTIHKIDLTNFEVLSSGVVAGHLLNQFSMDEHKDNLRVATTIGRQWWDMPFSVETTSTNDLVILDKYLKPMSDIKDLGVGERIYSARFMGDTGYVVTFKETDPFYVLDLADPQKPIKTGELKIPGYSSYLHPLTDTVILGIGKEGGSVKLSLFDISDKTKPTEISKYILDEYWSSILDTHHAFLADSKHEVFFLPGASNGYIFSYAKNQLKLTKAISTTSISRAVYINDYLYLVGDTGMIVLDEKTWDKVKEIELR